MNCRLKVSARAFEYTAISGGGEEVGVQTFIYVVKEDSKLLIISCNL